MSPSLRPTPLIVMEGIDGAGKGTQAAALVKWLRESGFRPALLSFPRYTETFFGARIGEFLNGGYGSLGALHPFLVSLLYAGDRFESRAALDEARRTADVVVLDRYVPSNVAHQSAKLDEPQRSRLREWIEHLEYGIYELPRPDLVVLFDVPVEISQQLIGRKAKRAYTDQQTDLQEADASYLQRVREVYLHLARTQSNWRIIPVADADGIRPLDDISQDVQEAVRPLLKR